MVDRNPFIADSRCVKFLDSLFGGPSFNSTELRFYHQMFAVFVAIEGHSRRGKDTVPDEFPVRGF